MEANTVARLKDIRAWVGEQLRSSLAFWAAHGRDREHGGVYTCLDRQGQVYSTDKSVWMQGRCAWTYARACRQYGEEAQALEMMESCLNFLEAFCVNRDKGGRMYFTVTEDGRPLRQRRYNFSEGFYAMANAEAYLLTGKPEQLERARVAYEMIWQLNQGLMEDPVGLGPKTIAQTRTGRALADPMIYLNLTSVLRRADPQRADVYDARARQCVHDIFTYHYKPDLGCTLESVGPQGEFRPEHTAGRTVNPGHVIECAWFLLEEANRLGDKAMHEKAQAMFRDAIRLGWDREYGGILYFTDCLGKPQEAYEHDMKLWWPHNEAAIASLMAYRDTGKSEYLTWFFRVMDYCRTCFADPEYPEWYGYLRRDGLPTQPAVKGSTFKGPFHLPRMLMMVDEMLQSLLSDCPR